MVINLKICNFIYLSKILLGGSTANILNEVDLRIFNNMKCSLVYNFLHRFGYIDQPLITDSTKICAGVLLGGKDSCQVE